ncbi:MAG: hypothetical protein OZ948_12950 [Deltaproteobacteria bacterium]|nr:hypothetical protein [Deltaproteobacteria bacterium]
MFSPRKRPLLLVADRLLALRLSLNTPVVATPDLPAGPARGAIAVHSEAGRTCFTVAVRSLRNGASVLYELEGEDLAGASGIAVALDAALSFGESMGFLFDDELVTARSEAVLRDALARLREIVAPPEPDVGETTPALELASSEEILLEEALEQEPSVAPAAPRVKAGRRAKSREPVRPAPQREPDPIAAPAPPVASPPIPAVPAAPPVAFEASRLTKFRYLAASGEEPPEKTAPPAARPPARAERDGAPQAGQSARSTTGGAMLGRVKPVRLRAPDAPSPVPALLRLLAGF